MIHYVGAVLYVSSSPSPGYTPLYEESFVLVSATSLSEAETSIEVFARDQEHSYFNQYGEEITWKLWEIEGVQEAIDVPSQGPAELISRFFRDLNVHRALYRYGDPEE